MFRMTAEFNFDYYSKNSCVLMLFTPIVVAVFSDDPLTQLVTFGVLIETIYKQSVSINFSITILMLMNIILNN